jgi:hypothetical protein
MVDLYNLVKIANVSIETIQIFQFLSMDNLKKNLVLIYTKFPQILTEAEKWWCPNYNQILNWKDNC